MSEPKPTELLEKLRDSLERLDDADTESSYEADIDTWTRDNPVPFVGSYCEPADNQRLEEAWAETFAIVQALEAAGYPPSFSEGESECEEVCGLSFVGHFDCQISFGDMVFHDWTHRLRGDAQNGSASFCIYEYEDEHGIPDIFFRRLGFELTQSDFPQDYEDACIWAGLEDEDGDWDEAVEA